MSKKKVKPTPLRPVDRMLPNPESVVPRETSHWSACPECGASKLSIQRPTPICRQTGKRTENGIFKYMRCRACGKKYTVVQPD